MAVSRSGHDGGRSWRVLRIIARLNMGGPAYHVSILSGGLRDRGFDTRLVHGNLGAGEASLESLIGRYGVDAETLEHLAPEINPAADLRAFVTIRRIIRDWRPDIVHTHTAKAGFLGRLAAASVRPRPLIVHTYHGHVLEGYFGPAKTALYRKLERLCGRVSDALVGVSQATVDDLVRLNVAPRERFRVIPLGLDLERFVQGSQPTREAYRQALGLAADDVLLGFVGRLAPIKRIDVLIRAMAEVRAQGHERVHLAVVGDGEGRVMAEELIGTLGLHDRVHLLGYRDDMPTVAQGADVAVIASDNEGTPVALIEAAAAGRPAVATDVGGVRMVVTADTGIVVPPADPRALARGIVEVATDPVRRERMGKAAQAAALSRFGADRLLQDVDGLYRELLRDRVSE